MATLQIKTVFNQDFKGVLITDRANVTIGGSEGELYPYDMLLGALASCLYSTFLDVSLKKRIKFEEATVEVTGEKRTEVPTTLKWVKVKLTIKNAQKEKGLVEAANLAAQYCSIYQTLSHVAEMSIETEFVQ